MELVVAGDKLRVQVYENLQVLQTLLPAWEELLSKFPTATIFSTWDWLASWWRSFGNDQSLRVLAFFDLHQELVGLAPLASVRLPIAPGLELRCLILMGDGSEDSDNLDFPVLPGYEDAVVYAFLNYLEDPPEAGDLCRLNTLPGDSPCGLALLRELERRKWTWFTESRPGLVVDLPGTWDQYLKQLTSKERGKIRYLTQRLEKKHSVRYLKCAKSDLEPALDALFRLHQDHWQARGEVGSFSSWQRRNFYEELGLALLDRGRLEFWLLELDGRKVAAQFAFRYEETVFTLQEGFDLAYSADSVGYVLRAHVLKQLIADGVYRYDFLGGVGDAKTRWGTRLSHYVYIHFAKPWTRGAFYLRSLKHAAAVKEQLRAHLPARAWAVLHALNLRLRGIADRKAGGLQAGSGRQS